MEEIYLILDNPSDYESYPNVLGFVLTEKEADKIVAKKTETYIAARKLQEEILAVYYSIPEPEFESYINRPKWPAGIAQSAITKEMKDERESIKVKNDMIDERNSIKNEEVTDKRIELALPILRASPIEIQKLFSVSEYDISLNLDHLVDHTPYFKNKTKKLL